MRISYISLQSC